MFRWVVNQTWRSPIRINNDPQLGSGATIQDARDATVAANLALMNQLASSDPRFSPRSYSPSPSGIGIIVSGSVESDPEVEAVALNAPVVGDTYERGETVEATVTFDRVVDVTGTPQLELGIGDNTRQASYARGTGTDSLVFSYKLVRADVDADGISVAAGALTLNGGTIRLMQRTRNAVLGLGDYAITDDGDHKVDGSKLTAPRVGAVFFRRAPANDETYRLGERIDLSVDFDRPGGGHRLAAVRPDHRPADEAAALVPIRAPGPAALPPRRPGRRLRRRRRQRLRGRPDAERRQDRRRPRRHRGRGQPPPPERFHQRLAVQGGQSSRPAGGRRRDAERARAGRHLQPGRGHRGHRRLQQGGGRDRRSTTRARDRQPDAPGGVHVGGRRHGAGLPLHGWWRRTRTPTA